MFSIKDTIYSRNFPAEAGDVIFCLDKDEAAGAFRLAVGSEASTFFDLPDGHWLVEMEMRVIGRWLESYNEDNAEPVRELLRSIVNWTLDDEVYYLAKKSLVIKSSWSCFTEWWDAFLACEDDAVILMRDINVKEGFLFTSLGEIRYFSGIRR